MNRGFGAPIIVSIDRPLHELSTLIESDTDEFVRWDAAQELAKKILTIKMQGQDVEDALGIYISSLRSVFETAHDKPAETALILNIPSESVVASNLPIIDPDAIYQARNWIKDVLLESFDQEFQALYEAFKIEGPYEPSYKDISARSLRNVALSYLVRDPNGKGLARALSLYCGADNLTDQWAALKCLNNFDCKEREHALSSFSAIHKDPLVLDKWLALEATSSINGTLNRVKALLKHPEYDSKNPNRIRALIGSFAHSNSILFHHKTGQGYDFIASQILEIDAFNPQIAARLTSSFQKWARYDHERKDLMEQHLLSIKGHRGLSADVREIVEKTLEVYA